MFKCERCGVGYSPIRAAILEFCPRCWARDRVRVPLVVKVLRDSSSRPRFAHLGRPCVFAKE